MKFRRFWPGWRAAWLLLIPLLLACEFVSDRFAGRAETPEPAATMVAEPSETPTAGARPPTPPVSPSPTVASPRMMAELTLLPAPLYFVGETGEIMRLEPDGQALSQITDTTFGIRDFDVSPVDGRLIYVSGNMLIETDPDGGNPIVKVDGGPIQDDGTGSAKITQTIDRPRFSPNGGHIAFGLKGINLILAGSATEYSVLLPSDPYPDLDDPDYVFPEVQTRFYWPGSWSPDGRLLQIGFGYYPEGGGLAVVNVADGDWNPVTNADGIECCDWAWSADSAIGFLASDQVAYHVPGLAQVDPLTGGSQTIIHGAPESPEIQLFRAPFAAGESILYTFVAAGREDASLPLNYHLAQIPAGATETDRLRDDAYYFVDYLWAADGRGAVIADAGPSSTYPIIGPLRWLPADGGPAVDLPASGGALRWGPP